MTRSAEPIFWTNQALPPILPLAGEPLPSLDEIGTKFMSDKASGHHGFLGFYERFLAEIRDTATSVLELGVDGGASLRMWEEYFPAARILGINHQPDQQAAKEGRISVSICGTDDVLHWVELAMKHGPFDLIVDDGTHFWTSQIAALRTLYPFVRPGGFYVLEDLDTSFGDYVERFQGRARKSAAAYLHSLNDMLVGGVALDPEAADDSFLKSAAARTEFIAYFPRTALLRRRQV